MTRLAVMGAIEADVQGDVTTESALVIDELIAVFRYLTCHLTEAQFNREALLAPEIFLLDTSLFAHSLATIDHTSEVRCLTCVALVEGTRGQGQPLKVIVELVVLVFEFWRSA